LEEAVERFHGPLVHASSIVVPACPLQRMEVSGISLDISAFVLYGINVLLYNMVINSKFLQRTGSGLSSPAPSQYNNRIVVG